MDPSIVSLTGTAFEGRDTGITDWLHDCFSPYFQQINPKNALNLVVSSHLNGQGEWPSLAASIAGKSDNVLVSSGLCCHME